MRILVTGGHGWIGSHLCPELRDAGHEVSSFDRKQGQDLSRHGWFEWYVDDWMPDIVIHLAAKVGRIHGEEGLVETAAANGGLTALVAKACGKRGIRLVYASSSEVYGDQGDYVNEESALFGLPHNMYGLTKRWGEEACEMYAPEGLTIWRIGMPYGPNQPSAEPGRHAAISAFLRRAKELRPIPVHHGASRTWCYIEDSVRAMRMTLEAEPGVYNIAHDNPVSMFRVAWIACRLTGVPSDLITYEDPPDMQTLVKRLSGEKIKALGWKPQVSLAEGMKRTLEAM